MNTIIYREIKLEPIEKLIIGSFKDAVVYIGINKENIEDFAQKIGFAAVNDQESNKQAIKELQEYFQGKRKHFSVKTEFLCGTEFQKKVWTELAKIPYGKAISYKQLAINTGNNNASRAVGSANSKNPIPIIIPCHRVINSNGTLGGFSCGLEVKKILLDLESSNC